MYAVISSPRFYKEIGQAIASKDEQILYKTIDTEIDIITELEKVSRIKIKHLIIDITSLKFENELVKAVRRYRIINEDTQIIIIAPNYQPGNKTLSRLVNMGVYDIINPTIDETEEDKEDMQIYSLLLQVLEKPMPYAKAVKWDVGVSEIEEEEKVKEKVRIEKVYIEKIESVFKKVIAVYSPTSEGASCIAAHLSHAIAQSKKCKVLLLDFNPLKPIQREIFNMNFDYTIKDALESIVKNTLSNIVLESFTKISKYNKNLSVLAGLYDINDFYDTKKEYFEEIIEKARFSYDYVVIDTHSWYDLIPTDRALYLADDVIIPVRGREWSLNTVNRYLESFEKYNDFDIRKFKLVINNYSGNDLTSIEIESKTKYPVIGYISNFKDYDIGNGFKNKKLLNEYVPILNTIGIRTKKKKVFTESLINLFKPKKDSKVQEE